MLHFNDFLKKKEKKTDYEIIKSRSGLPMFVLDSPLTQDDDEPVLLDDEPVKKEKSIPQQVSDYITRHF